MEPVEENDSADDSEIVVMPNMVMFSGMLKSEVQQMPDFAKQLAWSTLLSNTGLGTPVLKITARYAHLRGHKCLKGPNITLCTYVFGITSPVSPQMIKYYTRLRIYKKNQTSRKTQSHRW